MLNKILFFNSIALTSIGVYFYKRGAKTTKK